MSHENSNPPKLIVFVAISSVLFAGYNTGKVEAVCSGFGCINASNPSGQGLSSALEIGHVKPLDSPSLNIGCEQHQECPIFSECVGYPGICVRCLRLLRGGAYCPHSDLLIVDKMPDYILQPVSYNPFNPSTYPFQQQQKFNVRLITFLTKLLEDVEQLLHKSIVAQNLPSNFSVAVPRLKKEEPIPVSISSPVPVSQPFSSILQQIFKQLDATIVIKTIMHQVEKVAEEKPQPCLHAYLKQLLRIFDPNDNHKSAHHYFSIHPPPQSDKPLEVCGQKLQSFLQHLLEMISRAHKSDKEFELMANLVENLFHDKQVIYNITELVTQLLGNSKFAQKDVPNILDMLPKDLVDLFLRFIGENSLLDGELDVFRDLLDSHLLGMRNLFNNPNEQKVVANANPTPFQANDTTISKNETRLKPVSNHSKEEEGSKNNSDLSLPPPPNKQLNITYLTNVPPMNVIKEVELTNKTQNEQVVQVDNTRKSNHSVDSIFNASLKPKEVNLPAAQQFLLVERSFMLPPEKLAVETKTVDSIPGSEAATNTTNTSETTTTTVIPETVIPSESTTTSQTTTATDIPEKTNMTDRPDSTTSTTPVSMPETHAVEKPLPIHKTSVFDEGLAEEVAEQVAQIVRKAETKTNGKFKAARCTDNTVCPNGQGCYPICPKCSFGFCYPVEDFEVLSKKYVHEELGYKPPT